MERLWTPWRRAFVEGGDARDEGCFLCTKSAADDDRANLIVARSERGFVLLNLYPYNNGHLLVAPLVHRGTLGELAGADLTEPLETVRLVVAVLDGMLRPQGYNIGLNQGKAAGAGLPGHLHWHVVPRWDGDTNFMPVLGQTKVIVESLQEFYDRFVAELSGRAP